MFYLEVDQADFHSLIKSLASKFGIALEQDTLKVPPYLGKGFVQAIRLPNGLSVAIGDVAMDADVTIHRKRKEPAFYVLSFEEVFIKTKLEQVVGGDSTHFKPPIYSAASLHSTLFDNTIIASRGCIVRSVKIIFDARWLARYFGIDKEDELLRKYIALKAKKLTLEPLDTDYKKYINDILRTDVNDPVYFTIIENRIMLLMERFLNRIMEKMQATDSVKVPAADIYKMMEVEAELTRDDLATAPTVEELSVKYDMSPTRLKKLFRDIYGYPLYEYFQRQRMGKARALLLSGEYSVKEVGYETGYKSLSNFAKAFRQVFDYLPSDIIKTRKYAG
jgi:AraC-like DNA-binding protein